MKNNNKKGCLAFLPLIAAAVCILLFVPQTANAKELTEVPLTKFTDSKFRQYIKEQCDTDNSGSLNSAEILNATSISVEGYKITSLKGIEYLTNLQYLACSFNNLESLDLSHNTALTELYCNENPLTSLDVSQNNALEALYCYNNQLESLDVSHNSALRVLYCSGNQLSALDLTKNTALQELSCNQNQLTSLDVSGKADIYALYCNNNQLKTLNISDTPSLIALQCRSNNLKSLDLTRNTNLETLDCSYNQLKTLNLSKNTGLVVLYCGGNQLKSLNVTKNTALRDFNCEENQLTSLNILNNSALEELRCYGNQLAEVDISASAVLVNLYKTGECVDYGSILGIEDYPNDYFLQIDHSTNIVINPFTDVKTTDSYYSAVMWAVQNGITSGTSATKFSPKADCVRYQFAVMLYKLAGKPAVSGTLPFKDVNKTDSYYNAVLWAYTNGIISGTSATAFSPKAGITRYQVVQMLYKYAGKPAVSGTLAFEDVSAKASYYKAVLWAVQNGITKGTDASHFSPNAVCKRYQLVVFLYKYAKLR